MISVMSYLLVLTMDVNNQRVDCLMYADDILILSDSSERLQERLNALVIYCTIWNLNTNKDKIKVIVFIKLKDMLIYLSS